MTTYELTYLACPYTDPNPKIMQLRYAVNAQVAADLFKEGIMVFAASMHNAFIEEIANLKDRFSTWQAFNHLMIERSDRVLVVTLDGWEQSKGVQDQIQYAKKLNKNVELIEPSKKMVQAIWNKICSGDSPLEYPA